MWAPLTSGEPNGRSRVVMGENQRGPRPMLKAPMLLAAVLVVCVASSADAPRRHHGYYGGLGPPPPIPLPHRPRPPPPPHPGPRTRGRPRAKPSPPPPHTPN